MFFQDINDDNKISPVGILNHIDPPNGSIFIPDTINIRAKLGYGAE